MAPKHRAGVPAHPIERQIHTIRGQRVMLDADLAALYGVTTKAFNQAVRRNLERFPPDFMFQLSGDEAAVLRSQIVTLEKGRGRYSKYAPLVFTEHGVAMLAGILRSDRAVVMSVAIVRAFIHMRELIAMNQDIATRVEKLEHGQERAGSVIEVLVEDIDRLANDVRRMKALPEPSRRKIGFDL